LFAKWLFCESKHGWNGQAVMSQLETAQRHLSRALRRLEAALERKLSQPGNGSTAPATSGAEHAALARDVALLRDQCDRLSVALNEAQHDNRTLREVNDQVARRLDSSIIELDRLLGS
jgi:hypothetical protein